MSGTRTALVTGAVGFVGRHMLAELESMGWNVYGIDIRRSEKYPSDSGDACDIFSHQMILKEVSNMRFDLVVHCAYHVGGRAAIDGNPSLLALNLQLDSMMFDWAVRTKQHAVLYFSSSAAYPIAYQGTDCSAATRFGSRSWVYKDGRTWVPLHEDMIDLQDVRQPDARYGWAKITGEQLARAASQEGLRVHVLRPFSGYGSDQDSTYPFPAIIRRVAVDGDLSVWGPPGQLRDWIHIDDVVSGALAVYDADYRSPVNLCTGIGTEFGDLAVRVAKASGRNASLDDVRYLVDRPTGVMFRVGDPTLMHSIYTPKIRIDEGISRALTETGVR